MIESFFETELESKIIISEDSDEIAIINNKSLNFIYMDDKHKF